MRAGRGQLRGGSHGAGRAEEEEEEGERYKVIQERTLKPERAGMT